MHTLKFLYIAIVMSKADSFLVSPSAITLGRKLDEGGYGRVYLSQYNGTRVAVKNRS